LECVERARGELHSFHQLMGHADPLLGEACNKLRNAGHGEAARRLDDMVGCNVLDGRWPFQVVEEFDDHYWSVFREQERHFRNTLQGGVRHVIDAEMKERRRTTDGRAGHQGRPTERARLQY
jgi:hypothetical protein